MHDQTSIWTRIGDWFKTGATIRMRNRDEPDLDRQGILKPDQPDDPPDNNGSSILSWRRTQSQAVQRLEDSYTKLSRLVDSMHRYMEMQDERTRRIGDSLADLSKTIAKIPEIAQAQQEQFTTIAQQLTSVNERAARWEKTISQIPNLADAHRDTLNALSNQIDATRNAQEQIIGSIDGFREAVNSVGQASNASTAALREIEAATATRDERLMALLSEHNRRFSALFVVATTLAALLAVATLAVVFLK